LIANLNAASPFSFVILSEVRTRSVRTQSKDLLSALDTAAGKPQIPPLRRAKAARLRSG